ncbi:hypothetical protein IV48_GL000965 [Fructilactobacillus fructivorans]|nr:hypothetical protein FC73_GL000969 [Fructilactobacillus fructivorans]KRN42937.1 hypothetical protein IV48_GL000965 [Fructilactobacillus fructivorans]
MEAHVDTKHKSHKFLAFLIVLEIIIVVTIGIVGTNYYSKKASGERLINALQGHQQKSVMANIKIAGQKRTPDEGTVQPVMTYFDQHPSAISNLKTQMSGGDGISQAFSYQQTGKNFFVFPRYQLVVKPVAPSVKTNLPHAQVTVDGKKAGQTDDYGELTVKKLIPGVHQMAATAEANGKKLETNGQFNLLESDDTAHLNFKVVSFRVQSVPSAVVYVDNHPVVNLDKSGKTKIKNLPINANSSIWATLSVNGKPMQSEVQYLTMKNDNSQITIKFDKLVDKKAATNLINAIWDPINGDVSDDASADKAQYDQNFIDGKKNPAYGKMIAIAKQDHTDKIKDRKITADVKKVQSTGEGKANVEFEVQTQTTDDKGQQTTKTTNYRADVKQSVDGQLQLQNLDEVK